MQSSDFVFTCVAVRWVKVLDLKNSISQLLYFIFFFFRKLLGVFYASGAGRPSNVPSVDVDSWLRQRAIELKFAFTLDAMAGEMQRRFGFGSARTVRRAMDRLEFLRVTERNVPLLLQSHKEDRKAWSAAEILNSDIRDETVMIIHLDEKYFYAYQLGKHLWVPKGMEAPIRQVPSRRFIPKVS